MADPPPGNSGDGARVGPGRALPPRTPRWVKIFGIIIAVVVVVFVILLISGGEHGPSRHSSGSGNPGGNTQPVQSSPQNMVKQSW